MNRLFLFIILLIFVLSCGNKTSVVSPKELADAKDSVGLMMTSIAQHISADGPADWLHYFEKSPGFFMASAGELTFPDNESATRFINNTLVKDISKIDLQWKNVRVEPLTADFAAVAMGFHENITDAKGTKIAIEGYFTAVAHHTANGWLLHNAHWSIVKKI